MILTPHILAGAAIATRINNPIYGFVLAFLSHYFLDFIPHQEYLIKNITGKQWYKSSFDFLKIALDISLGVLIIILLTEKLFLSFAGGFFTLLPDGFTLLFLIFPKNKFLKKHYYFHQNIVHYLKNKKILPIWRIFSQILIIFIASRMLDISG